MRQGQVDQHNTFRQPGPHTFNYLGVVRPPRYGGCIGSNRRLGTDLSKCPEDIKVNTDSGSLSFSVYHHSPGIRAGGKYAAKADCFCASLKHRFYLVVPCKLLGQWKTAVLVALLKTIPEFTSCIDL
jgi:hypothetical protein